MQAVDIDAKIVEDFAAERLMVYELAQEKPNTFREIDAAFMNYLRTRPTPISADDETASKALRTKLFYRSGYTLGKFGTRKRTTVNVYMMDDRAMTLRPQTLPQAFGAATASGASASAAAA